MTRYGSREILDVVLKDIRTKEPVVYLESLTTSSIEIAGETVYARGGRGNPRLIGWDSDKDIDMNMEDALISKESLAVLVGAKFEAGVRSVHEKEALTVRNGMVTLKQTPDEEKPMFVYLTSDGSSIGTRVDLTAGATPVGSDKELALDGLNDNDMVIVDYYYETSATTKTITIDADVFPGTYMLEGTTLWRREDGVDVEAKFTIPKLKVTPGFTIPMANSGDPQTFTFTCNVLKSPNSKQMFTIELLEEDNTI